MHRKQRIDYNLHDSDKRNRFLCLQSSLSLFLIPPLLNCTVCVSSCLTSRGCTYTWILDKHFSISQWKYIFRLWYYYVVIGRIREYNCSNSSLGALNCCCALPRANLVGGGGKPPRSLRWGEGVCLRQRKSGWKQFPYVLRKVNSNGKKNIRGYSKICEMAKPK